MTSLKTCPACSEEIFLTQPNSHDRTARCETRLENETEVATSGRRPREQSLPWIFTSPDYKPLGFTLTETAAAERVAALYDQPTWPTPDPEHFEIRFCLPAPRVAAYRDLQTNELVFLRREKGSSKFSELTASGWGVPRYV